MDCVIDVLAVDEIDRVKSLWLRLLAHHARLAGHLEEVGAIRAPEDSWRQRRAQYVEWLSAPLTRVFVARDGERPVGYAMVRVVEAPGSWRWGDRSGVLETLVVDDEVRGAGVGQALVGAAREHLAGQGIEVMKISVLAGNDDAMRFYRREGAVDFVQTVVMPVAERPVRPEQP